jgi:hypothetical protein
VRRDLLIAAVLGLAAARAAAEPSNVELRPTHMRLDAGFGAPTGMMGLSVGHGGWPPWGIEAGFGLGVTGWQLAVLARGYWPIGESLRSFVSAAGGPSLSLIGKPVGLRAPHSEEVEVGDGDVFGIFGVNVEVGWELRLGWGGLVRVAVGGFLRLHENMAHLCHDGATVDDGSGCVPPHFPSGPEVARISSYPYLAFGYGWSF